MWTKFYNINEKLDGLNLLAPAYTFLMLAALVVGMVWLPSSSRAAKTKLNETKSPASANAPDLTWISGGHAGGVGKAALSSDGQMLATADYSEIYLWNYANGKILGTIGATWIDAVKAIRFSPDGQFIFGGGTWLPGSPANVGTLRMWRVSDKTLLRDMNPGAHYDVRSLSLSADGNFLAVATSAENVLLFDALSGTLLKTLGPFDGRAVAISPDGSLVAATGADVFGDPPSVNIWRTTDGALVTKLVGLSFISDSIAFSPNGQYLAAGDWGGNGAHGRVLVWQVTGENFAQVQSLTTQFTGSIYSLGFSPDSQTIAAGGTDDAIWLWHLPDGALTRTIDANLAAIWNIIFTDNNTLFAGGADFISHIWRVNDGAHLRDIGVSRAFVTSVAFSPDGNYFAADNGHSNNGGPWWVEMFQAATGVAVRSFSSHNDIINSVAFSPDNQLIASASGAPPPDTRDTRIMISRVSNGLSQRILQGHSGGTVSIAFSPDGQTLASGGRDNLAALWRVSDGTVLRVFRGHNNWVQSVAFSPDGQTLATGSGDSTVKLWRVSDGALIRTINGNGYPVGSISFSPDGQTLALAAYSAVQLWRVGDGVLLRSLYVEADAANLGQVVFSRDGSIVMSANRSYPPTIWFWRVSDGVVLQTYKEETGWVQPPVFAVSPDNMQLGIGRYDAIVEMARLPLSNASAYVPNYEGNDDSTDCSNISGWAWDSNQPDGTVTVDIYDGDTFLATIPANQYRPDLFNDGKGNAYHGFKYSIPANLKNGTPHSLGVRISNTGAELTNSPMSITCGSLPPSPNTGTWSTLPPMPTARQNFAVGVINGKLYAVGGDSTIGQRYGITPHPLNTLEVYDPETKEWSTLAPMPIARLGHAAGVINGKLYVVGGWNSGYLNTLQVYDPAKDRWSTLAPMPTARYELAAAVMDGQLYVIGGYDPNAGYSNKLEVYDPATDSWIGFSPMPSGHYLLSAAVVGGKLYAVGGIPGNTSSTSLYAYQPATDTWTTLTGSPMGATSLGVGAIDSKIYTAGGGGPTNATNLYNPTNNTWSAVVAMPTARGGLAAGVINGKLYALGGVDSNRVVLNTLEVFTPAPFHKLERGALEQSRR